MKITMIRHGEMAGDPFIKPESGVCGCLSENGIQQAESTNLALASWDFTEAFSSPYGRAMQTAETVLRGHGLPITILDFLHEWLPDRSLESIPNTDSEAIQAQVAERYPHDMWKTELGEGTLDTYRRVGPPFLEVIRRLGVSMRHGGFFLEPEAQGRHIVVFAHGGSLGTLLTFLLQLPIDNYSRFSFELTGVATLVFAPSRDGIFYPRLQLRSLEGL